MSVSARWVGCLVCACFLAACGGDPADPDAGGGADAGGEPDAGPVGETLDVVVLTSSGPVEGATVTVAREGDSLTATSDASGRASLEGVLPDDVLHVTLEGHIPLTFSAIPARTDPAYFAEGVLTLRLYRLVADFDRVTVRGAFSNGDAAAEWRTVTPTPFVGLGFGGASDYSVSVLAGAESRAAVLEFDLAPVAIGARAGRNAVITTGRIVTFPASAADATVDIDLSVDALPVQTSSGSFPIPAAPHALHERGTGFAVVFDLDHRGWFLGETGYVAADAENTRFDYEANWIAPSETTNPITEYTLQLETTKVSTIVDGFPGDGAQPVTFLDLIDITAPDLFTPWRVGDVATVAGLEPTSEIFLELFEPGATLQPNWIVVAPPGTPVWLPSPPPGGVGATTLSARPTACERESEGAQYSTLCRRSATGQARDVEL